jgi:hypothetical protein
VQQYLIEARQADPNNILFLKNDRATRKNITNAIQSHFRDNTRIPNDGTATMILFFSGHGSRAKVEGNLIAADNKVEVICPVDERTKRMGEYVYAIPDYVLGWLLREVAAQKGPNIVRSSVLVGRSLTKSFPIVDCDS